MYKNVFLFTWLIYNWNYRSWLDPDSLMNWEELGRTQGYGTVGAVVFDGVGNLAAGHLFECWHGLLVILFYIIGFCNV